MTGILIPALPISLLWVAVTGRVEWGSLLVGYVIGVATLAALRGFGIRFRGRFTVRQVFALLRYSALLFWNGLVSSIQLAGLLMRRRVDLRTGIVALETGDRSPEQILSALSAHGLNMTPGELVIDFNDSGTVYVHCLDINATRSKLDSEQRDRIRLLREILGVEDDKPDRNR